MSDIYFGSLLYVAGAFVAVVQERFAEPGLPWRWEPLYDRTESQRAEPGAPAAIYVGSAYAEEDDVRDALPRVVVSVPQASLRPIAVGNRAALRNEDRGEAFTAFDELAVSIECRGRTAGEAATVADVVRACVACQRLVVREVFRFHDVSLPSNGEPRKQGEYYASVVSFQVTAQIKWFTQPISPRLQEIAVRVSQGGAAAQEIALHGDFTR